MACNKYVAKYDNGHIIISPEIWGDKYGIRYDKDGEIEIVNLCVRGFIVIEGDLFALTNELVGDPSIVEEGPTIPLNCLHESPQAAVLAWGEKEIQRINRIVDQKISELNREVEVADVTK